MTKECSKCKYDFGNINTSTVYVVCPNCGYVMNTRSVECNEGSCKVKGIEKLYSK